MADLDFITDLTKGFKISLTDTPNKVVGNRALLNRFEIVFLTQAKSYILSSSGEQFVDRFGGNADVLLFSPHAISNPDSLATAISVCIEYTVNSISSSQPERTPKNEKLQGARLLDMYIDNGVVFATVEVTPVETDSYETLVINLPVIKRGA